MKQKGLIMLVCVVFFGLMVHLPLCLGDDLDDGIAIDDSIDEYDQIKKPDKNVRFIKLNARSRASSRAEAAMSGLKTGGMNVGGVNIVGDAKGDVIVIFEGKNMNIVNENK